MKEKILIIICLVLAGGIAAGTYLYYRPKLVDYQKGRELYNGIRDDYTGDPKKDRNHEPEEGTEAGTEAETEKDAKVLFDIQSLLDRIREGLKAKDYMYIKVDGKALKKRNPDYVGWLYIPKTNISYPVVLSKDNKDYLHTNFDKGYNYAGTIFIDFRNKKSILDHHMIIYGHNMRDGSMFSKIKSYVDKDFMKEHPVIWFITPEQKLLYRVFSAYEADPYDHKVTYSIQGEDFKTNKEWDDIVKEMKNKSAVKTKQEVNGMDFVMTLSTCTDGRTRRITPSAVLLGEYDD